MYTIVQLFPCPDWEQVSWTLAVNRQGIMAVDWPSIRWPAKRPKCSKCNFCRLLLLESIISFSFNPFTFCTEILTIHILSNFNLIVEEMEVELLVLVIDLKSGYVFLLLDIQYRCYYNMYKLSALFLIHALFYESA